MYNFVCLPSRVLFTNIRVYNYNYIRECRKIFTADIIGTVAVPANPGDSKPFVTQATADHPTIALRDASAVQAPNTVDSSEPTPGPLSCTSTSEQEQYPGKESSHLVASLSASKSGVQPSESFKMILEPITHLTSMLVQSNATVAKKKDKVSNLKKRQKEVEGFLSGKDEQIKQLENKTEEMAAKLKEEQEMAEDLMKKQQKIDQLKDDIYKKEMELKQEKDDRQETCEQLEKAQADLKAEKNEKKTLQKVLSAEFQSIQHLQEVVNRTTKEVESTREERETMKNILLWTDKDIHDEEDELAMEEQQRKKTNKVTYFLLGIIIVLIAILVIL